MTIKEAFKQGFCEELARRGVAPQQLDDAVPTATKAAVVDRTAATVVDKGAKGIAALGLGALALPPAIAAALGYVMAGGSGYTPSDVQALHSSVVSDEYADAVAKLMRRQRQRRRQTEDVQ